MYCNFIMINCRARENNDFIANVKVFVPKNLKYTQRRVIVILASRRIWATHVRMDSIVANSSGLL